MSTDKRFRESLIASEPVSSHLKAEYDEELKRMLERPLKRREKVGWVMSALITGFLTILFAGCVLFAPAEFPLLARGFFLCATLFSLAWVVLSVLILKRGTLRTKTDEHTATGMMWGFLVIIMVGSLLIGQSMSDVAKGTQMIVSGLVFLVMFGHMLPMNRINRAELTLREELLRLRVQVADLAEQLTQRTPHDGPDSQQAQ